MRATVIAIALAAAVASCKGKSAPKVIDAAVIAVVVEDAAPAADAGRPWFALPIDASPDAKQFASGQLPYLGGEWGAVELSAVDAPAGKIMGWLASDKMLLIGPKSDGVIRGYASSADLTKLAEVLHTAFPNVVPAPIHAKGKTEAVDLQFAGAKVADLYRLLSDVERRNYVLGPGDVLDVDISAKRVPAATVSRALADAIGRGSPDTVGNVTYIHDPSHSGLDEALIKLGGPTVDLDINDGRPGEAYAALNALGATNGGATCSDGAAFDLRLRKVKAGVAVAVIAAISGVPPGDAGCVLGAASRTSVSEVRMIASAGKRRVAIVGAAGTPQLLDSKNEPADTIGTAYISTDTNTVDLYPIVVSPSAPAWNPASVDPPPWAADVEKARLVATLIDNDRRLALIELADGTWQELTNHDQNYYSDFQYTIGSGRLWFYLRRSSGTPIEGSLMLQEK
jgi:hypothetical protein